jgi:hypothetical protein
MGFSAEGNLLFVVDARSEDVAVVRTAPLDGAITRNASLSVFTLLPAGRNPNAIADKAFQLP